jgi:prepilin-type processing-associated H-X9-DG protein
LLTYAADNGNFPYGFNNDPNLPPPDGGYAGYAQYDRLGWWWFNYPEGLFNNKMGKRTILQCPSKNIRYPKLENDILCGNYGVNLSICKLPRSQGKKSQEDILGEPLAGVEVKHPSLTLLLLDCGYAIICWWQAADIPPFAIGNAKLEDTTYVPGLRINKDRLLWKKGVQEYDALFGRHPRKTVNICYLDGHVGKNKADDLLVEKKSEGYNNRMPLWHQY